jgi:hypothetical protein
MWLRERNVTNGGVGCGSRNKYMIGGIIYYTDNRIGEPIIPICQKQLLKSGLPIVSCSLKPIDFGQNIVLENRNRSYPTMVMQILTALEASTADYVFFCEHDVLYAKEHFDFVPPRNDIFYYNINNWRWEFPKDRLIHYDELTSLSMLCCNRLLALDHYKRRLKMVEEMGLDEHRSREPRWARKWGYEPGTKKRRRGGFSDEEHEHWLSEYPNIDIRHKWTFSKPKVTLDSFKHQPTNWRETTLDKIPGWNLKSMFNL